MPSCMYYYNKNTVSAQNEKAAVTFLIRGLSVTVNCVSTDESL